MLDGRSQRVLWAVIESYIDAPDPVGSRYVTKKYEFGLSPATIRNIMADLEYLGFLMQPHTSAGRVPTDLGYRFYVEHILNPEESGGEDIADGILSHLSCVRCDVDELLQETTRLISNFSHYLGVASSPRTDKSTFHKIEMMSYKNDRIVVMLFTDEGVIRHKVIPNELSLRKSDLGRLSSYMNSRFKGMTVADIRKELISEMKEQKDEINLLIAKTMDVLGSSDHPSNEEVIISGFNEVMSLPDFADIEKIKQLSETIENKHAIVKLIDQIVSEEGVQIVIGAENRIDGLQNLSIVANTYRENDRPVGVIGVIGPKRMHYQNAIMIVNTAARCITEVLSGK